MLTLLIGNEDYWDEQQNCFVKIPLKKIRLEHSLRSLAKWESKWNIPFLSTRELNREQTIDYVRCMEITGQVDESIFQFLTSAQLKTVNEYINAKMTATTVKQVGPRRSSGEKVTAEIIYFWMIQWGIPPEYDKWHLNRLLMLIEVCAAKSGPQKKMGRQEQLAQQRAINNSRKAKLHTKG